MKKIVALLLVFVMVLSMTACEKKESGTDNTESATDSAATTNAGEGAAEVENVEVVEDDEFTHTFTQYGNARIKIVGTEATQNAIGEDVLCVYYDYTNTDNIADGRCPFEALKILGITQDGEELDAYASCFIGEGGELYIQPGCTNRNTLTIRCNPDGGVVKVSCYIMIGSWIFKNDDIEPFEFEIDPNNLMGAPAPFELPAITEPTYTSNMSASGEWEVPLKCEGSINGIELTRDRDGKDLIRVNLTVTNKDEEEKSAGGLARVVLYQDGVALQHVTCVVLKDEDIIDSDETYNGYEVSPGETVECSALFYPRTMSPVEAVIENHNSDKRLGACFDLEAAYDAAEAEAAATAEAEAAAAAAEAEAASAADKAIMEELVGTWDLADDVWPEHVTFNADLTGFYELMGEQDPFTYSVTDGVLHITYNSGNEFDYEVSVSGDNLVLTDIFQDEQTYVRAGSN